MKRLVPLLLLVVACGAAPGTAGVPSPHVNPCQNAGEKILREPKQLPERVVDPCRSYTASVVTARGTFVIKLDPVDAPITVNNFVFLSQRAFYNHLTFHRVEDFVVQGGDPTGTGSGGPGYGLPPEASSAAWVRGSVGMAASSAGVNGSQFFVLKQDAQYLAQTGIYNHFGTVTAGMDVVDHLQVGDEIVGINIAEG